MGTRRRKQIDDAIASWAPRPSRITREQGEEIVKAFRSGARAVDLAEQYRVSK